MISKNISIALALGVAPAAAILALPVDLEHALAGIEVARGRDLLDQRLDVRAEELGGLVAGLADQVEVPGMPVGVLEAKPALAEVHLPRDASLDHPLQGAVDGGAADARVLAADQVDEVVGAEVPLLAQEHVDDPIALAGSLPALGAKTRQVDGSGGHHMRRPAGED